MNNISKFISSIMTEASLDGRIPSGVLNLENPEHIQVVAEAMYDACEDENVVNEFVKSFVDEGKYPDRQAYNKDGWLVTFPSAQYKQAAIKKGTHFGADPTHGKGGMHLYYKKRGKQKRQTQQSVSATEPADQSKKTAPRGQQPIQQPAQKPQVSTATDVGNDQSKRAARLSKLTGGTTQKPPTSQDSPDKSTDTGAEKSPSKPVSPPTSEKPDTSSTAVSTPAAPAAPAAPSYTALSVKFATSKGWKSTPYGEWRDSTGTTAAVVGLSGEVVPIKNVDREELKIFAAKNSV
jgi:hypothetical protein